MSEKRRPLAILLDGNSLLHRAWHAVPPLTAPDGQMVNAVFGFAIVLEKLLEKYQPDFFAVAWDLPGGTFRHEAYAPYKAQREKKSDELYEQIPLIQELLAGYGVPSLSVPGFEADDILATLATKNAQEGAVDTVILTGDLDSLQLVQPGVVVDVFVKGLSEVRRYDAAAVQERYGLRPDQLIHYKALRGDASDHLPGVPGIGEKTAVALLQQYGDTEGILRALRSGVMPEKFARKFSGQEGQLQLMLQMVTAVLDVPLQVTKEQLSYSGPDVTLLVPLFQRFSFTRLLKKYSSLPRAASSPRLSQDLLPSATLTLGTLHDLQGSTFSVLYAVGAPNLFGSSLDWFVISDGATVVHLSSFSEDTLLSLRTILARASVLYGYDLKQLHHLLQLSRSTEVRYFDAMVMAYVLNPGGRGLSFLEITRDALQCSVPEHPVDQIALLPGVFHALSADLQRDGMLELYLTMEAPLIPLLYEMERVGILVDRPHLVALQQRFAERIADLTVRILALVGHEVNINSPVQLADVLFGELGLPTKGIKKTKSGYSTAASELEKLWDAHPIIPLLSEYREVTKLKSTYADTLPHLVRADGRIHTSLNQCVAATGRLSSSDPNLQNIPIRSSLGREIRSAFIAPPGKLLLSIDYSQIELRLAAAMANDATFLKAFADGIDIHAQTAADVWGVPVDQVTKNQRAAAKVINFSILYGVGPRALARATDSSFDDARRYIARYFEAHPAISAYMDAQKLKAASDGYVETLYGRRRYLPDIQSGMAQVRAAAERMAINMPIQGTEADILKLAMLAVDRVIREEKLPAVLLLQVHDELLFEVDADAGTAVATRLASVMEGVANLALRLPVDTSLSSDWGSME